MYKQETILRNGEIKVREITEQTFIEMLLQMHFLIDAGEDIKIFVEADESYGFDWNNIQVTRTVKGGKVVNNFSKVKQV